MNKVKSFTKKFLSKFYNKIGIDLGTANTLVYISGQGIVINEPSVVALNQKTNQIVAIGSEAKQMIGRTPRHIKAIKPLYEGVISDYEITQEMLSYFINKAEKISKKYLKPQVVIGVPTGITNVESRAVYDVALNAGAREVYLIEEPMAAAIGMNLPIKESTGSMVIDIGGGTTDIAVISLGGIVKSKNLKIAGDHFNEDIISYFKEEFKILIGVRTAEEIKTTIGWVISPSSSMEARVRGRDLITGLPREINVNSNDIKEALSSSINVLIEGVKEVIETTPPEILSDVMKRGIYLTGGGAMLLGLNNLLFDILKIPIFIAESPLETVVQGTGIVLENLDQYKDILITENDQSL